MTLMHKKTRPVLSNLSLPSPIQKYFSSDVWDIDLSTNTNPYLGHFAQYPDIQQVKLKEVYLDRILSLNPPPSFKKDKFSGLSSENILFTVGSMEGLDVLLRTFAEPNKDVICIGTPTFPAYKHWALIHNLKVEEIPLSGEGLESLSIENIIKINPKMVFLCNPNNPTGTVLKPELIEKLCESIEGLVVVDEAYIEFSTLSSSIFCLNKYNNLIILRTFSKAWGLAGVRCGVIISNKAVIHALRHVQLPFGFSSFSQKKVRERLFDMEETVLSWKRITQNRDDLMANLLKLKAITKIFKSHTNFIMMLLKDFQEAMTLLKRHKILVLDCSASLPNSIRVSLGSEEQNMKFLAVMQEASLSLQETKRLMLV